MLKSFKTEINPTEEQRIKIHKTIGVCRYIYNFYIAHNKGLYNNNKTIISGKLFSVWLNNTYIPNHQELSWIQEVSSKSVKRAIENANTAFVRYFYHQSAFPKFKKKGKSDVKMYFVKNNSTDCKCERHRINIPTLGWVRLKEKGYIPTTKAGYTIRSGTISMKAGRYYISALVELPDGEMEDNFSEGIGIDLELKVFAAISNRTIYKNINKVKKVRDLEKQLRREQKCLFRKYENLKKGKSTQKNIRKQKLKVQKIFRRICNIRTDYINKIIAEIVKIKPSYITMKDLHVKGMMKNKYLMKSIISQKFYEFRNKIKVKCEENGIELRIVDEKYLASSICYCCGIVKNYLKPCDKIFLCECGYMEDKYLNTALNLKDATIYTLA